MPKTVAILNSNDDVINLLRVVVEQAGFTTVTGHVPSILHGNEDFLALIRQHDPAVILYDIGPPYGESWAFLQTLLSLEQVKDRKFVLTTTNEKVLRQIIGADPPVFEI